MFQATKGLWFRYVAILAGVFESVQKAQDLNRVASCKRVCCHHVFDLLPYIGHPVGLWRIELLIAV